MCDHELLHFRRALFSISAQNSRASQSFSIADVMARPVTASERMAISTDLIEWGCFFISAPEAKRSSVKQAW
jgi:hypothetical protein